MATKTNLNLYSRLKTKIHNIKSDIIFLKKCKKFNVFPKFLKIKCAITNNTTDKVINQSKRTWLNLEIGTQFQKLSSIELELYNIHLMIIKNIHCDYEFNQWLIFGTNLYEKISVSIRKKNDNLHRKFLELVQNKSINKTSKPVQIEDFVKNLSSEQFNETELNLLNYGLKFAIKPIKDPVVDVVVDIETILKYKSENVKHHIRSGTKHVLKEYKQQNIDVKSCKLDNIHTTIECLKKKQVYYLKADKGNSIIIMDKSDYDVKMLELITSGDYITVRRSPLNKMIKNSREMIKKISEVFKDEKGHINKKLKWKLLMSNPKLPMIYGLPKIHKSGPLKMRPVVSNIHSPNYKMAKWLVSELKQLPDPEGCSIKNSFEFAEKIIHLVLEEDEIPVSFDVEALFPSIPVEEALVALDEWLIKCNVIKEKREIYLETAKTCMEDSYFQFRGTFYKLTHGTSMGNPLSPIIANLYMSKLEMSLKSKNILPKWWHRYVDDGFAVVKKGELDNTLKMLNSQSESINFTYVAEENNQLAFLDLLLIRQDHKINVAVYHKPTSTQRYIPSTSYCPIQHKMAAFHSMAFRLCKLPLSLGNFKTEYEYILQSALLNGYNKIDIDRIIKKHSDKIRKNNLSTLFSQSKKEEMMRVRLTFAPKITNKLKNTFKRQNLQIVYSTQNKLCTLFETTKDKIEKNEKSGIYEITCENCPAKYYGQTRRSVKTRYKEHLRAIKIKNIADSAVAVHAVNNKHWNFDDSNVELIKPVSDPRYLDAYESFFIYNHRKMSDLPIMNESNGNIESYLFNCI